MACIRSTHDRFSTRSLQAFEFHLNSRPHTAYESFWELFLILSPLPRDFQANIDILEANKGANKEEIRRLRAENKDVRLKLSQLVRGGEHGDEVKLS